MNKLEEKFRQLTIDEDGTEVQQCLKITEQECIAFQEFCDVSQEAADFNKQNRVFPSMDGHENITVKSNRVKLYQLYLKSKENG